MTTEHRAPTPLEVRTVGSAAGFRTVRLGPSGRAGPPTGLSTLREPARATAPSSPDVASVDLADELARTYQELSRADHEIRALRAELERFAGQRRSLSSVLPLAVVTTDRVGRILSANLAAGHRLDVAPRALERKPLLAFVHPGDRRTVRTLLDSLGDEPSRVDLRLVPHAREPELVQVVVAPQGEGEVTWTVLGAVDESLESEATALAVGLAELCRLRVDTTDRWRLLSSIATIVRDSVGTVDAASTVLGVPDEPSAVGSSGDLAAAMDGLQMRAGEGPTLDAHAGASVVIADDLRRDERWPALAALAAGVDVRSTLAVPLWADGERVGTLTCYSRAASAFGPSRRVRVEIVASAVGAVLADAFQRARLRALADNLEQALVSRQEIDEAKGIVMGQRRCGPDDAFRFLARLSQQENVKLRALAHRIVSQAAGLDP